MGGQVLTCDLIGLCLVYWLDAPTHNCVRTGITILILPYVASQVRSNFSIASMSVWYFGYPGLRHKHLFGNSVLLLFSESPSWQAVKPIQRNAGTQRHVRSVCKGEAKMALNDIK